MNFSNFTPSGEPVPESANPSSPFMPSNPTILAADCPLIVPMQLKISLMKLRAIVVLIISRTTGVTLSFKTDPLESVLVSSTFDSLPSVRRHLQTEIENRLRDLFQKELPAMIHLLSNEWLKKRGLSRRSEDVRDVFSSPDSVSALFPAPNRTISPPSVAGKNSAPPPKRIRTPKSTSSFQKNPSIAAKSAPAELEIHEPSKQVNTENVSVTTEPQAICKELVMGTGVESCGVVALVPEKVEKIRFPEVFDFMIRGSVHQSCYSEIGLSMSVDQYYLRSKRSIIVRAPTDLALPDPVLIDSAKLLKKKSVNVAKLFRSLFKIPEIEESNQNKADVGLKAIEGIGMGLMIKSGTSSVKSTASFIPDNCSVRSRTTSILFDVHMNKALSTMSGNMFSRIPVRKNSNVHRITSNHNLHHHHHYSNYHDRYSEADPDLVQFEPDEFRSSDFRSTPITKNESKSKTLESLDGESRALAIKFGIMRKLQSTLAPNNFVEKNILYRTMSQSKKNAINFK